MTNGEKMLRTAEKKKQRSFPYLYSSSISVKVMQSHWRWQKRHMQLWCRIFKTPASDPKWVLFDLNPDGNTSNNNKQTSVFLNAKKVLLGRKLIKQM